MRQRKQSRTKKSSRRTRHDEKALILRPQPPHICGKKLPVETDRCYGTAKAERTKSQFFQRKQERSAWNISDGKGRRARSPAFAVSFRIFSACPRLMLFLD